MLKIFINDEPLDFKIENEKKIGGVLGEVEKFCNKNGHTIFHVQTNEKAIAPESLDELFKMPVSTDLTLRLFTRSGEEIKESIKILGKNFFEDAESLTEVSVKMQTGDDLFVLNLIEKISENMKTLLNFLRLENLSKVGVNTKLGDTSILEEQQKVNEFLKEITDAFEEKDIITVSDLSEYELAPALQNLGKGLATL